MYAGIPVLLPGTAYKIDCSRNPEKCKSFFSFYVIFRQKGKEMHDMHEKRKFGFGTASAVQEKLPLSFIIYY